MRIHDICAQSATARVALVLSIAAIGTTYGANPNPVIWPQVKDAIGLSASPTQILATRPWCASDMFTPRQVVSIAIGGAPSLFYQLPFDPAQVGCNEEKIAISPGRGGFLPNYVYVSQGPRIIEITPDGSNSRLFATLPDAAPGHVAITFDTYGTFGFKMVVDGGDRGTVYTVDPSGVVTLIATILSPSSRVHIETGEVVTSGPYAGYFLVAAEDNNTLFAVSPPQPMSVVSVAATYTDIEAARMVPANPASFQGSGLAFFEMVYDPAFGEIRAYPQSAFAGLGGQVLVTNEQGGTMDTLELLNTSGGFVAHPFDSGIPASQEGASFVNNVPLGCVEPINSYLGHAGGGIPVLLANFGGMLSLGTVSYSVTQLEAILMQPVGGNGLISLSQELIAAKLNALNGAAAPQSVVDAIHSADSLIDGKVVPPFGSGSINPSLTAGLEMILDVFSNGRTTFGPLRCDACGSGLSISNYQLLKVMPGAGNQVFLTYRADVNNPGPALASITASIANVNPFIFRVAPGQGTLMFSPVPAGGNGTSNNTFTVIALPGFDPTQLSWAFQSVAPPPIANPGQNQTVKVGSIVTLDGSGSVNSCGICRLTYDWRFTSRPPGTKASEMKFETTVMPTFIADAPGVYVIQLKVSNGTASSTASVSVTAM